METSICSICKGGEGRRKKPSSSSEGKIPCGRPKKGGRKEKICLLGNMQSRGKEREKDISCAEGASVVWKR